MTDTRVCVLFLCTGNSCRSQMAEGWTRHLHGARIQAWSAGLQAHGLNLHAVQVMAEAGVDISGQTSKTIEQLPRQTFDHVITVCDHAREHCPIWPAATRQIHVGFADPPALARNATTEAEKLDCYRRVRDEIRAFVIDLPVHLPGSDHPIR